MFFREKHPIAGISISDDSLEAICLQKSFPRPYVISFNRMILPTGYIFDGEIVREDGLSEAFSHLLRRARPYPYRGRWCILSLPDSKFLTQTFIIPRSLNAREREQAIFYEVEKRFPVSRQEMFYDYEVLEESDDVCEIFFTAIPKSLCSRWIQVLQPAGILPAAIEMEMVSVGRALLMNGDFQRDILIVDIGRRYAHLGIFFKNRLRYSFTIPFGITPVARTLASTLDVSEEFVRERLWRMNTPTCQLDLALSQAFEEELVSFTKEIKRIIQFYLAQKSRIIDRIILTGGMSLLPNFHQKMQSYFIQPIEKRNPLVKLWLTQQDLKNERGIFYSTLVGLGLRSIHRDPPNAEMNVLR